WGVFVQPLGFLLFVVAMFAECYRTPFDVVEGDSEIVAGFHTEYASGKLLMIMTAAYLHVVVASALIATFYLGGYDLLPFCHFDADFIRAHLAPLLCVLLVLL